MASPYQLNKNSYDRTGVKSKQFSGEEVKKLKSLKGKQKMSAKDIQRAQSKGYSFDEVMKYKQSGGLGAYPGHNWGLGSMGTMILIGFVIFALVKSCDKSDNATENPVSAALAKLGSDCATQQGVLCNANIGCDEEPLTNVTDSKVCCKKCKVDPIVEKDIFKLEYVGGDKNISCVEQGTICDSNQVCEDSAWVRSNDTNRCCQDGKQCLERIFSNEVAIPNILGDTVKVEKTNAGYVVWWGTSSEASAFDEAVNFPAIGHTQYSLAECVESKCNFKALNNNEQEQVFTINVIDNGDSLSVTEEGTQQVPSNIYADTELDMSKVNYVGSVKNGKYYIGYTEGDLESVQSSANVFCELKGDVKAISYKHELQCSTHNGAIFQKANDAWVNIIMPTCLGEITCETSQPTPSNQAVDTSFTNPSLSGLYEDNPAKWLPGQNFLSVNVRINDTLNQFCIDNGFITVQSFEDGLDCKGKNKIFYLTDLNQWAKAGENNCIKKIVCK